MTYELAKILGRMQKHFMPTVHVLVARALLAQILAYLQQQYKNPEDINRELHRMTLWSGSLALIEMAKPQDLKRFFPSDHNPNKVAKFMKLYGSMAWYLFAGYMPKIDVKIIREKEGTLIRGIIYNDPSKPAFFSGIETIEGVNTLYLISGSYESASNAAFNLIKVSDRWYSLWRPYGEEGIIGFYVERSIPVDEAVSSIENEAPDFFKTVSLEFSAKYIYEYQGIEIPVPRRKT